MCSVDRIPLVIARPRRGRGNLVFSFFPFPCFYLRDLRAFVVNSFRFFMAKRAAYGCC